MAPSPNKAVGPWMKFYPGDWRADPALRVCSIAARGLWMEMVCLMHEGEPYGSLVVNGSPISERQLAGLAALPYREVTLYLAELRAAGVFSEEGRIIYSRRMRRDVEKAQRDKANGRGGGNPKLKGAGVKGGVNPPDNPGVKPDANPGVKGGVKAQKLEARSQSPDSDLSLDSAADPAASARESLEKLLEGFLAKYPKRHVPFDRRAVRTALEAAVKLGAEAGALIAAAAAFATAEHERVGSRFIKAPERWIAEFKFADYGPAPPVSAAMRPPPAPEEGEDARWSRVKAALWTEVGAEIFSSWFIHLKFVRITEGAVMLVAPTAFQRSWFRDNQSDRLLRVWQTEAPEVTRIELQASSAVNALGKPSAAAQADVALAPVDPARHSFETKGLAQIISYGRSEEQAIALMDKWRVTTGSNFTTMVRILVEATERKHTGAPALRWIDQQMRANRADKMLAFGPREVKAASPAQQHTRTGAKKAG